MFKKLNATAWTAALTAISLIPTGVILGAEMKKPGTELKMPTQQVSPAQQVVPRITKPCEGPDPAIVKIDVRKSASSGKGYLTVVAAVQNAGTGDFVSNPDQAAIMVQVYDARQSGASAYTTVKLQKVSRLNKGASLNVRGDRYRIDNFIEWGHRTATSGECQAEREAIVYMNYDPDIRMDGNPRNDDCNANNNRRTETVPFMVQCPW